MTISPIQLACGVGIAPIGLVGMLNCSGAVRSVTFSPAGTSASGRASSSSLDVAAEADSLIPRDGASSKGKEGLSSVQPICRALPASPRWFAEASTPSVVGKAAAMADAIAVMLIQASVGPTVSEKWPALRLIMLF